MTPDSTSLTSVGSVFPISVQTADGTPLSVSCQGTLLSTDFSVPAVSHVPQLTMQLLSVGQLTDLGCRVGFDSHTCFSRTDRQGRYLGLAGAVGIVRISTSLIASTFRPLQLLLPHLRLPPPPLLPPPLEFLRSDITV